MQLLLVRAHHLKATDEKKCFNFPFWKKEQQHIFHFVVDCPCGFILKVPPSCYLASHLQHPSVLYSTGDGNYDDDDGRPNDNNVAKSCLLLVWHKCALFRPGDRAQPNKTTTFIICTNTHTPGHPRKTLARVRFRCTIRTPGRGPKMEAGVYTHHLYQHTHTRARR